MASLIQRKNKLYFTEILGFCCIGNHFHLLVRMLPENDYSDSNIKNRYKRYYGDTRNFSRELIPFFREKWSSLSEFIKEIKQEFSRFSYKRHNRRGFFWGERFKSVIVENGETLVNCLAYIDLNPVRAGIVKRPEEYRWNSIGYHLQTENKDDFLSTDFGLKEFGTQVDSIRIRKGMNAFLRNRIEQEAVYV